MVIANRNTLQKKAAYNLIRLNLKELLQEHAVALESWQKQDYRKSSESQLLHDLATLGIKVDRSFFEKNPFDTPEQMTASLTKHLANSAAQDHAYLIIFELWRRYLPEKITFSIACDELDHLIMLYDAKGLKDLTLIEDQINLIHDMIEESIDHNIDPKKAFDLVENATANCIEDFLYDYILDLIKDDELVYAGELIEDFYPYLKEPQWFDFLKARLCYLSDPEEGLNKVESIIHDEESVSTNIEFNLEMLSFLANCAEPTLFAELAKKTLPLLQTEEDLVDFIRALTLLYAKMGNFEEKKQIHHLLEGREEGKPLDPTDPVLEAIHKHLNHSLFSKI